MESNDLQNMFNKLLFASLSEINDDDDKKCLISDEVLENNCIKLLCNHSFNYDSLFHEIYSQKINKNSLETQRLSKNQIKCPYCRRIHVGLLPYRIGYPKIRFVNWPPSMITKNYTCSAILKSGKRKGQQCGKSSYDKYCSIHKKYQTFSEKSKNVMTCQALLKSGKKKGQKCGCQLKSDKNKEKKRCGKHLKINKDIQ